MLMTGMSAWSSSQRQTSPEGVSGRPPGVNQDEPAAGGPGRRPLGASLPLYAGGHRCADQESGREPLKDRLASTTVAGMKKVFQALGVPANVYSDDGSEFKREFKELMDF